jgi:hypothetical protein
MLQLINFTWVISLKYTSHLVILQFNLVGQFFNRRLKCSQVSLKGNKIALAYFFKNVMNFKKYRSQYVNADVKIKSTL